MKRQNTFKFRNIKNPFSNSVFFAKISKLITKHHKSYIKGGVTEGGLNKG